MSALTAPVAYRFEWRGEHLTVYQDGPRCWVEDFEGMTYARLSANLDDHQPAEGRFTLRWWSENQALAEHLADLGVLRTEGSPYVVSGYVSTMDAWIDPKGTA